MLFQKKERFKYCFGDEQIRLCRELTILVLFHIWYFAWAPSFSPPHSCYQWLCIGLAEFF